MPAPSMKSLMVRADKFNPNQYGASSYYDPRERLRQIEDSYEMNPGRAPNGTGTTGLLSGDSKGWSRVLEEQQEYLKLRDLLEGGKGINVRVDPRSNFRSALEPMDDARPSSVSYGTNDQPGSALGALQKRLRGGYTSPANTRLARGIQNEGGYL